MDHLRAGIVLAGEEKQGGAVIEFFIPGNPSAQKRHRDGKGYKYDPSAPDKKDFLFLCYQNRPHEPLVDPLKVDIEAVYSRPKSHYGTGKNKHKLKDNAPYYKVSKPDRDNIEKFIFDALNGVFWVDDSYIVDGRTIKRYGENPGIKLKIVRLQEF